MFEQRKLTGFQDNIIDIDGKMYICEEGNSYKNKLRNMMCLDEQINQEYDLEFKYMVNEYVENQLKEESAAPAAQLIKNYDEIELETDIDTNFVLSQNLTKTKKYFKNNQHHSNGKFPTLRQQLKKQPNSMKCNKKQSNPQLKQNIKMKKNKTTNKTRQLGNTYKLNCFDDILNNKLNDDLDCPGDFIDYSSYPDSDYDYCWDYASSIGSFRCECFDF